MDIFFAALIGSLSAIAYGMANAFSRPLSQRLGTAQTLFLRGFTVTLILALISIPYYHNFADWPIILAALGLGIAGYLPLVAFTHAIKESPIGIIAPIAGTSPLITVILSFIFLNVVLDPAQWIAIVLIILASIAVSIDLKNWRQSNFLKVSSGIPFAAAAAFGWGIFFFLLVLVTRRISPLLAAFIVEVGVTVAAGIHLKLTSQTVTISDALKPALIKNGILICIGTLAFTIGVRYFNVGIVAALSNSTAIVSSLLGVYLFKERLKSSERIATGVMITSVAALSLL